MSRKMAISSALVLMIPLAAADTGRGARKNQEWKDEAGRVIKVVNPSGRMVLYYYDQVGRIARIDGFTSRADNAPTWVHCFSYSGEGRIVEIDCSGNSHELPVGATVNREQGTALQNHQHGRKP